MYLKNMPYPFGKKIAGFTLIELLVVISIIATLSAIAITVFTGVQKGMRDVRRKSDLEAIRQAIEMYYNANGRFPGAGTCNNPSIPPNSSPYWNWSACQDNDWDPATDDIAYLLENGGYIQSMPIDPLNDNAGPYTYMYEAWPDEPGAMYVLCINLEQGSGSGGWNHNYCIKGGCTTCH